MEDSDLAGAPLVDTHAHLDMAPLGDDVGQVVDRARGAGVGAVVTVGIDLSSSSRALQIAKAHECVFATVGIHPHDADRAGKRDLDELRRLSRDDKVVAWGEIGLDFAKGYSSRQAQERIFRAQLRIAAEEGLPVIIHARDAHEEVLSILVEEGFPAGKVVFHCFAGDVEMAGRVVEQGFLISVTGIVTFPKAEALRRMVASVPLERLLLETDCPFLSPVPFRGKTNEPSRLSYIAEAVARVKGVDVEEVAKCTTGNAREFFGLSCP